MSKSGRSAFCRVCKREVEAKRKGLEFFPPPTCGRCQRVQNQQDARKKR